MKNLVSKSINVLFAFLVVLIYSGTVFSQTQEWTTVNSTNPPSPRWGHSLTTLPDGKVLLYGGENSSMDMYNDLYSYDNGQWGPVTPVNNPPSPRKGHSTWYINGKKYVHGGRGTNQAMGDLWTYTPSTKQWQEVQTVNPPSARSNHKANYYPAGNYTIISGGSTQTGFSNEIWKFDHTNNTFSLLSNAPGPIAYHNAEIVDDKLYILFLDYVYILNLLNLTWTTNQQGPPVKFSTTAVGTNDLGQKIIFVFGGYTINGISDKVYEYNTVTNTTSIRSTTMPKALAKGASATIAGGAKDYGYIKVLLFGGWDALDSICNTTLEFTLGSPNSIKNDNLNHNISISPNPASKYLSVEIASEIMQNQIPDYYIINLLGQKMKYGTLNSLTNIINIEGLSVGEYFLIIPDIKYRTKFLKNE